MNKKKFHNICLAEGLVAEGYLNTPHNQRLQKWQSEHSNAELVYFKKNEKHAGHVKEVKLNGMLIGRYEWAD